MDADRTRSASGWGYVGEGPSAGEVERAVGLLAARFPGADLSVEAPMAPPVLPAPRLTVPAALASFCTLEGDARRLHAVGRSSVDVLAARRGQVTAPDAVALPRSAAEVAAVLDWCADAGAACIPFGGGTSVVGGVNPPSGRPVVTLQTRAMGRVLEVDRVSRAARIQAGAVGPDLEAQLRPSGLSLRFYPQSFELSTLGGWIATRAGGHFATVETRIDDLVESVRAVTPAGPWQSRRAPSSGAGVSPDRMLLGSEGILGVITEAWVRVRPRPQSHSLAAVRFGEFSNGIDALRAISQSALRPSNCRLIDAEEARMTGASDGTAALLVLGFEAAEDALLPVGELLDRALALCSEHGGEWDHAAVRRPRWEGDRISSGGGTGDAVGAWRAAFFRAPYLRDAFVAMGILSETFETAVTWERFDALHEAVMTAASDAIGSGGRVTCRISHVYPDGPAPYYTVLAAARRGEELEQWAQIKRAATDALMASGGTVTHHHAVGRDHRAWYDRQRPDPFAAALRAVKSEVDPGGLLNPGVLIDP